LTDIIRQYPGRHRQLADGWIPPGGSDWLSQLYRESRPRVDAAAAAGRDPAQIVSVYNFGGRIIGEPLAASWREVARRRHGRAAQRRPVKVRWSPAAATLARRYVRDQEGMPRLGPAGGRPGTVHASTERPHVAAAAPVTVTVLRKRRSP
jgi:hypothetical protein